MSYQARLTAFRSNPSLAKQVTIDGTTVTTQDASMAMKYEDLIQACTWTRTGGIHDRRSQTTPVVVDPDVDVRRYRI